MMGARPVCAENFIRFDCVRESHNVDKYACATLLLSDAAGLAVQIEIVDLKQRMSRSDISCWCCCAWRSLRTMVKTIGLRGRQAWQANSPPACGRRAISMGCVLDQNSAGR